MSTMMLKNFCVEPTTKRCVCVRDIRCGGIVDPSVRCPEHGRRGAAPVMPKTHFHPIQGPAVGTKVPARYDDAKAS